MRTRYPRLIYTNEKKRREDEAERFARACFEMVVMLYLWPWAFL